MAPRALALLGLVAAMALASADVVAGAEFAAPVAAADVAGALVGQKILVKAILQANAQAKVCAKKEGCFGKPVTVKLLLDVKITKPLPPLEPNAHLVVFGACRRKAGRCIIDGGNNSTIFSPQFQYGGAPSKLELKSLIFQKAKGGVLPSLWSIVTGTRLVFKNNIDGVITAFGAFGGFPPQNYTGCRWINNNGSAIKAGNAKLGLANTGVGFSVRKSSFLYNAADPSIGNGGAVYLAGYGTSRFEDVTFEHNYALNSGGAVYADETDVRFRNVKFLNNIAELGGGAFAGINGYYRNLTTSFCGSFFEGNLAPRNKTAGTLSYYAYNPGYPTVAAFCETPIPKASAFEPPKAVTVISAIGKGCYAVKC